MSWEWLMGSRSETPRKQVPSGSLDPKCAPGREGEGFLVGTDTQDVDVNASP